MERKTLFVLASLLLFAACNSILSPHPAADFAVELNPSTLIATQGTSQLTTVTLTSQNGFKGVVSLALERQDGTPAPIGISVSPGNLNVTGPNPVSQALTVQVGQGVPTGTYDLRVKASAGSTTRTANLTLTVTAPPPPPDFTLLLTPTSLTLQQGGNGIVQLTLTPRNGFTGTVSLALVNAPAGVTLSPGSLDITRPEPVTQSLTLATASSTPTGTHALKVRATGGGISREADLTLTVTQATAGDFTMTLEGSSLTVAQGDRVYVRLAVTGSYSGSINLSLVDANKNPFSGVSLSPTSTPVPSAPMLKLTASLTLSPGTYNLFVRGQGGNLVREAPLTLTVTAPPPSADFSIALNPTNLTVPQGTSSTTNLTLTPQNGFTGPVSLTLERQDGSPTPSGISLSPGSLNVTGTNPMTQTLTVAVAQSVATGTYNLRVKASAGSLTRVADLNLTVTAPPDFNISLNPTSLSVQQGGSGSTTLTLTPQNGFQGQVNLSVSGAPPGVQIGFQHNPWNISGTQTQAVTVSVGTSASPGNYTLTLTATGGTVTKTANLNLTISTSSQANLYIAKAEWGQTVLKENLRLVTGKPALLRVHLLASPSPISLSNPLAGAVYLNSTFQGNLAFSCPSPIPTTTDPGNLATTCTATLPSNWVAPGLRVELQADPQGQVAENNESDNLLTLIPSVGAGTVLYLTVVPVIHQGQQAQVPSFSQTLWRAWPLKEVSFTTRAPYTFSGTLSPSDGSTWARLLDELRLLRQADGSNRYYYGFVRVSYTSGIAGIGYLGYPVAVGWDYSQSAPAVMAHELGHNFDREHAPCGVSGDPNYPYAGAKIGTWGYDLANGSLKDPSQFYDLMSYCGPQWVSDYTYEGAQSFLETSPPAPLSLMEAGLLFSGRIRDGEVVFNPPLKLNAAPEGKPSAYRLRAEGPGGPLEVPVHILKDSEGTLHFQARLPLNPYTRVGLYLGSQLLKEATLPLLPQAEPQVELKEEGSFLLVHIQGYPYFSLFHVASDGTRTALGLWHRAGEVRFALENLPAGGQWEIQLTDGLNIRILLVPR